MSKISITPNAYKLLLILIQAVEDGKDNVRLIDLKRNYGMSIAYPMGILISERLVEREEIDRGVYLKPLIDRVELEKISVRNTPRVNKRAKTQPKKNRQPWPDDLKYEDVSKSVLWMESIKDPLRTMDMSSVSAFSGRSNAGMDEYIY